MERTSFSDKMEEKLNLDGAEAMEDYQVIVSWFFRMFLFIQTLAIQSLCILSGNSCFLALFLRLYSGTGASTRYLLSHLVGFKLGQKYISKRAKKWSAALSATGALTWYLLSHLVGVKLVQKYISGKGNTRGRWNPKLFVGLLILLISDVSGIGCPENQTAELGGQGRISCNFPDDFNLVYWYDNISDSSPDVIQYRPSDGTKSGPGFDSREYDVDDDGSLIIPTVTTSHNRMYRVVVSTTSTLTPYIFQVSLDVIASPGDRFPELECDNCDNGYYYNVMRQGMTLSCFFKVTRPPVQLEWFKRSPSGLSRAQIQEPNITQNRNGTYNSLATVHLFKDDEKLIELLVCRASWLPSEWQREKEILVDFSQNKSFFSVLSNVFHMEIYKYAQIPCGGSSSAYIVWKRILPNIEPEIIGFHSHVKTETIIDIPDTEVSAEGSLVFTSPRVLHEGNYTCIYGDGLNEEIQMTSVEILIPPSPPYIQIPSCDDVADRCLVKENTTERLECTVNKARPPATLEWVAKDTDQISFFDSKVITNEQAETSDTILSVRYKVSEDISCVDKILIHCHLGGPLSKIIKAESTAIVMPASCKEHGENREHGLGGGVIAVIAVVPTLLVAGIAGIIIYRIYCSRTNSTTADDTQGPRTEPTTTVNPAYSGVPTDEPPSRHSCLTCQW